eukprot:scaffold276240_cov44-Prasinocladus_malaysianus.AAC.2
MRWAAHLGGGDVHEAQLDQRPGGLVGVRQVDVLEDKVEGGHCADPAGHLQHLDPRPVGMQSGGEDALGVIGHTAGDHTHLKAVACAPASQQAISTGCCKHATGFVGSKSTSSLSIHTNNPCIHT